MNYFNTRSLGRKFEKIATDFLIKRAFKIIETNYQTRIGEIDIIALDQKNVWHFVEVKSKQLKSLFGLPEEAVNYKKQRKIIQTVEQYLMRRGLEEIDISLDVLVIEFNVLKRIVRIALYENAFEERN